MAYITIDHFLQNHLRWLKHKHFQSLGNKQNHITRTFTFFKEKKMLMAWSFLTALLELRKMNSLGIFISILPANTAILGNYSPVLHSYPTSSLVWVEGLVSRLWVRGSSGLTKRYTSSSAALGPQPCGQWIEPSPSAFILICNNKTRSEREDDGKLKGKWSKSLLLPWAACQQARDAETHTDPHLPCSPCLPYF